MSEGSFQVPKALSWTSPAGSVELFFVFSTSLLSPQALHCIYCGSQEHLRDVGGKMNGDSIHNHTSQSSKDMEIAAPDKIQAHHSASVCQSFSEAPKDNIQQSWRTHHIPSR